MTDNGSRPEVPRGQGYNPPPKAPPHPYDQAAQQGYPQYGPQNQRPYAPAAQPYQMPPQQYVVAPSKPTSGKAIASLVCGAISFLIWPLAVFAGPAAVITGAMAMKETGANGTKGGRGLAIGGIVAGSLMFVACLGFAAPFFFVFQFAESESKRMEASRESERQHQAEADADADLRLIHGRLQLYYTENGSSLKPGGPVVTDGWEGGLIDENAPRVKGKLEIKHLVRLSDLNNGIGDYELEVIGDRKARVRHRDTNRELSVDDIGAGKYSIRSSSK